MNGILASPLFWIISIPFALFVLAIGVYLWCWISDKSSGKTIAFRICTSVLILFIVMCCVYAFLDNLFLLDRSARVENGVLLWNGTEYQPVSGRYDVVDRVAMTEDGSTLYNIKGDKGNRFIAIYYSKYYHKLYAKKEIWLWTEEKELFNLDIYYNNSPVGVITPDYIGRLNGELVYAK